MLIKRSESAQTGSLLLSAVVIITLVAGMSYIIVSIFTSGAFLSGNKSYGMNAFYTAEAGIARASYLNLKQGLACVDMPGHTDLTNTTFNDGQFTVVGSLSTVSPAPLLSAAVNASQTNVPISTLTGLTPKGQVMIDREALNYTDISTDSGDCTGSAPCLVGVTRGVDGTTATAHTTNTAVGQRNCLLTSQGGVPNLTSPLAKHTITAELNKQPDGWVAGDRGGSIYTLGRWDGSTWSAYSADSLPYRHLRGISVLSYADAWVTGNQANSNALLIHWDGSSWSRVFPSPAVNETLYGLYCIAAHDCWAVGNARTFLHYDGSNWTAGSIKTTGGTAVPNVPFTGVSCTADDDCWAVGQREGGDASFVEWTGSQWRRKSPQNSVPNQNLNGVSCVAGNDCWAVGQRSDNDLNIDHWNGSNWSRVFPAVAYNTHLFAIYCVNGSDCWAVGAKRSGRSFIEHWDGTNWTRYIPAASVDQVLRAVSCYNTNDCWAAGNNSLIAHWNGATWTAVSAGTIPSVILRAIGVISPPYSSSDKPVNWKS